jgi:hypothetical protein
LAATAGVLAAETGSFPRLRRRIAIDRADITIAAVDSSEGEDLLPRDLRVSQSGLSSGEAAPPFQALLGADWLRRWILRSVAARRDVNRAALAAH